jgi:hypothetical protein
MTPLEGQEVISLGVGSLCITSRGVPSPRRPGVLAAVSRQPAGNATDVQQGVGHVAQYHGTHGKSATDGFDPSHSSALVESRRRRPNAVSCRLPVGALLGCVDPLTPTL